MIIKKGGTMFHLSYRLRWVVVKMIESIKIIGAWNDIIYTKDT
jgi:hypothetical protein